MARYFFLFFIVVLIAFQVVSALTISSVVDEGKDAFKIETEIATYFLQKQSGGLSSLLDKEGVDWIDHHPQQPNQSGSLNQYRGIPNLGSSDYHPGSSGHTTVITSQTSEKIAIVTTKKTSEVRWEFYNSHAVMSIVKFSGTYWVLYEGVVGGSMDINSDYFMSSQHAERVLCNNKNTYLGDLKSPEWVCYGDPKKKRVFYFAHHDDDAITDMISGGKEMTILGFGRGSSYTTSYLTKLPNTFSFGFIETDDYTGIKTKVEAIMQGGFTKIQSNPAPLHPMKISNQEPNTFLKVYSLDGKLNIGNSKVQSGQMRVLKNYKKITMPGK